MHWCAYPSPPYNYVLSRTDSDTQTEKMNHVHMHAIITYCNLTSHSPGLGQAQTFSACSKAQALIKVLQAVSTFQALIYNVLKYFLKHFQSALSTN